MEFQYKKVWYYLIYTRLLVYAILILAYFKNYILHDINMWNNIIILESFISFCVICDHVTVTHDKFVTVMCDVISAFNSKPKK